MIVNFTETSGLSLGLALLRLPGLKVLMCALMVPAGASAQRSDTAIVDHSVEMPPNVRTSASSSTALGLKTGASPQGLMHAGGLLVVKGGVLQVKGDLQLDAGTFTNNGNVFMTGNLVNNQVDGGQDTGTITFNGDAPQTISGSVGYQPHNLTIDATSGMVLNNPLQVNGTVTFLNGVVDASVAPLIIGDAAVVAGVSDASHVNGYVMKKGTGSFTYPVGAGGRYQPVTVDLVENSDGMSVRYMAGDAGQAPFANSSTSVAKLEAYNNEEYWDLTPAGTAAGRVTISWDDFRNPSLTSSENINVFSVAHRKDGSWMNEGSAATGSPTAGSVTSELVSSWSPFTLGVTSESGLPVTMIRFQANVAEQNAVLEWETTSEDNASHFDVERSLDARNYRRIGTVAAAGASSVLRRYTFTDVDFQEQQQTVYYRLRSVDQDGTFSLTKALALQSRGGGNVAGIYPNPVRRAGIVTVWSGASGAVSLWDKLGRQVPVRTSALADGSVQVSLSGVSSGLYFLKASTSQGVVSHKLVVE